MEEDNGSQMSSLSGAVTNQCDADDAVECQTYTKNENIYSTILSSSSSSKSSSSTILRKSVKKENLLLGNFGATSVASNASVESVRSVISSSNKTKFHSFLQNTSATKASSRKSENFTIGTTTYQHQHQQHKNSMNLHSSSTPSLTGQNFSKIMGDFENLNELKIKKNLHLNRKISILSPLQISIKNEQIREERTCSIDIDVVE